MKKLVVSALLIVLLLLGTASPVLAATNYTVFIPSGLSIDLMGKPPEIALSKGEVILNKLTAGGSIYVTAVANEIVLKKEASTEIKDRIPVKLTNGDTSEELKPFYLSNSSKKQTKQAIRIETIETGKVSQNHLPGNYEGSIMFTFKYVNK